MSLDKICNQAKKALQLSLSVSEEQRVEALKKISAELLSLDF